MSHNGGGRASSLKTGKKKKNVLNYCEYGPGLWGSRGSYWTQTFYSGILQPNMPKAPLKSIRVITSRHLLKPLWGVHGCSQSCCTCWHAFGAFVRLLVSSASNQVGGRTNTLRPVLWRTKDNFRIWRMFSANNEPPFRTPSREDAVFSAVTDRADIYRGFQSLRQILTGRGEHLLCSFADAIAASYPAQCWQMHRLMLLKHTLVHSSGFLHHFHLNLLILGSSTGSEGPRDDLKWNRCNVNKTELKVSRGIIW